MIIGAVLIVGVAIVLAVTSLGGSKSHGAATTAASTSSTTSTTKHAKVHHKAPAAAPANAAEIQVAVLNGTETTGLAHRVSSELQQAGYSQAGALNGSPPGAKVTTVEYAAGHQGDAESVAHSLAVTHVQPLEASAAALAGSAGVVVIVGADKTASG
jgi:hypothetical protein